MRWSATRLRWLLLGGVFLLAAVVAGFFGLARYRAGKIWQRILARNGVNLRHESNGVTWSQSSKGRTIFTIHASKATPEGNNKWALEDAVLVLYGREPGRDDRIYGKQFEYDQDQQVARALGEVHMDLQAPEPGGKAPVAGSQPDLGFATEDASTTDPGVIHVRTSGLVYMRKMGIAATAEPTEFRYRGMSCTSRGAEFDNEHSLVRLLADVRLTGQMRQAAYTVTAAHAELDRLAETADLTSPVMTSGERSARAAHALFHLHKDGSLEAAEGNGAVELRSGTETVSAPQLNATFGKENRPDHARLFTGVQFSDSAANAPAHGTAKTLDLGWSGNGELNTATAAGAVTFAGTGTAKNGSTEHRQMHAEQAVASFGAGQARHAVLRRIELTGGAEVASTTQPAGPAQKAAATRVDADELTTDFAAGSENRIVAQSLTGLGHTQLDQTAENGAQQHSTGDSLDVTFASRPGGQGTQSMVSRAVQTGHVAIQSWAAPHDPATTDSELTTGHADKGIYTASEGTLTLLGSGTTRTTLEQTQGELAAEQVVLHQGSGDAEASGNVAATSFGAHGGLATHVLASRAKLLHTANLSQFFGDGTHPAQLWQGGSQVQADEITLDGKTHGMSARPDGPAGRVHAVFSAAGKPEEKTQKAAADQPVKAGEAFGRPGGTGVAGETLTAAGRNAVQVTASRMDYDDAHHEAFFAGGVTTSGVAGAITAERGAAFLKPAKTPAASPSAAQAHAAGQADTGPDLSGSLDRMVMLGDVHLTQPGREGTGEQLTYTAATDSFALTGSPGKPPRVTGEGHSVVTGATLLFRNADSTIVVAGAEGKGKPASSGRVHTETDLKQ